MQAVFAHTQSRRWGIRIDIQEVVATGLSQGTRRQLYVQKCGGVHRDNKGAKTPPSGGEDHC